jgi:DnaJ-domain-containing protein 1
MVSVCYSCHEPVHPPVCVGCGALQPPSPHVDPFDLLGVERRFHLDGAAVEAAYRGIARKVHPDRFAARPAVERRMALLWTAAINEARRVLKDDRLRGRFLATGQAAPRERGGPTLDPTFLAEIFDWRERDEEEPGVMTQLATAARNALLGEIDSLFTRWEAGQGSLDLVDDRLARLNYLDGLLGRGKD